MRTQASKILGHIVRAPADDPMRQATFVGDSLAQHHTTRKRVGRPRTNWTSHHLAAAWAKASDRPPEEYLHSPEQQEQIRQAYVERRI